jgi:hypothetical protein
MPGSVERMLTGRIDRRRHRFEFLARMPSLVNEYVVGLHAPYISPGEYIALAELGIGVGYGPRSGLE